MSNENNSLPPIRVLGIGSPFGLDQLGWQLLEALQQSQILDCYSKELLMLEILDRPGANLLHYLENAHHVLLLDAVIDDDCSIGETKRYLVDEIQQAQLLESSHGFGVQQALSLAKTLGQLPQTIELLGIAIGTGQENNNINWDDTILALATSLEAEIVNICDAFLKQSVTS